GRDDVDAVRLDAAVRLPGAGHGDGLALLKIRGLADHGLAHDGALIERDLDVGVAAGVMDGEAAAGQVGDRAGGAPPGRRSARARRRRCVRRWAGSRQPTAAGDAVAGRSARAGCGRIGRAGRSAATDLVAAIETTE